MYCPRCGSQNAEKIKFCRQCGLSLQQITSFVAAGGTGALQQPAGQQAEAPMPLLESSAMLALKQKRIMTLLAICIAPVIFAILGEEYFRIGDLAGIPFLLVPFGVIWTIYRFKIKMRKLQEEQMKQHSAMQQAMHSQPTSQRELSPSEQQAHLPPAQTNPFDIPDPVRGSVIEDETRKLPIGR